MKITAEMKIKDVLAISEEKMIDTLVWLAPAFERLRYPKLRRVMSGRVTVRQAAKIARLPLTEMLYALNLAAGEDEADLSTEIFACEWDDFAYSDGNLPVRPIEIAGVSDDSGSVTFVDLMPLADAKLDPLPTIVRGLARLKHPEEVLLIKHPFDPIPLRELLARRGYASWAEERKAGVWFVYFYRPRSAAGAHAPVSHRIYLKAFAAAA